MGEGGACVRGAAVRAQPRAEDGAADAREKTAGRAVKIGVKAKTREKSPGSWARQQAAFSGPFDFSIGQEEAQQDLALGAGAMTAAKAAWPLKAKDNTSAQVARIIFLTITRPRFLFKSSPPSSTIVRPPP